MTNPAKIAQAAESCLELAARADRPFVAISRFVGELQAHPDWTDREIIDVQARVIRSLLKRFEDGAG